MRLKTTIQLLTIMRGTGVEKVGIVMAVIVRDGWKSTRQHETLTCVYLPISTKPCLREKLHQRFLSESRQSFTNSNNFWYIDDKIAKTIYYVHICHLTSLMSLHYLVKHKSTNFYSI